MRQATIERVKFVKAIPDTNPVIVINDNMTVWILAGNYISFAITAGLIRLHMPGVKKSRV